MASSRPSSPVGDAPKSPGSPEPSPRSKIQAMLAAVDDSSDDDQPQSRPSRTALFKKIEKPLPSTSLGDDEEERGESSEEEIVRPRGRMAARMLAGVQSKSPEQAKDTTTITKPSNETSSTESQDDEDGQDIQVAPRKRIRAARDRTPEPARNADAPSSPGLFVTPSPQRPTELLQDNEGGLVDLQNMGKNDRFFALVARKRQEKEAKEREDAQRQEERARRLAEQSKSNDTGSGDEEDDVSDIDDDAGGLKLTQRSSRPARKAGKKAQEEMNRETQRLARSLQLAHEAKTRKKITKASLFERFNFRVQAPPPAEAPTAAADKQNNSSRPSTPNSLQQSDAEMGDAKTPPSSPPSVTKPRERFPEERTVTSLPAIIEPAAEPQQRDVRGKAPQRHVRVKVPAVEANLVTIDSDDELEIVSTKPNRIDEILKKLPAKKDDSSTSMTALMRLANLSSPPKGPGRGRRAAPSISAAELQASLVQRAREQAKLERDRRVEELRAKGIHIQTEEERERQREEIEDMVAKARREVEEIMQRERDEAKKARKEKKANGEADPLAWDDSDDDSYDGSDDENAAELELSGSEDEGADEDEDEEGGAGSGEEESDDANEDKLEIEQDAAANLFESEAQEDAEDNEEEDNEAVVQTPAPKSRRPRKHIQIVSDDEDDAIEATPRPRTALQRSPLNSSADSPQVPTSVLRSATKTFIPGLPIAAARPAGLGMTQMFAGTMDDSQEGGAPASASPMEFMPSFDNFPDSQFSATAEEPEDSNMVLDSQPSQNATLRRGETQTQGVQLHFSQSQVHGFDSSIPDASQMSEALDLTQDEGFQEFSPLKQRFIDPPYSTIETVPNGSPDIEGVPESPLVKRRGKLMRRVQLSVPSSTLPPTEAPPSADTQAASSTPQDSTIAVSESTDAFKRLEKAARRQKRMQARFDRKKSRATEMVEEQAEESEDEYAGLGGADGEDSSEEDEELAKMMIDDAAGNDADEQQLAGLHAERVRAADAAQVDKLFRDITTGMLRKRRRGGNNDFDLSDSDDDGEARRRMKRRQFAKMQKALFADERIGKIAENPRNSAFMKSIEDRDSDDEWDFGDNFAEDKATEESQSQEVSGTEAQAVPESQRKVVEASQNVNLGRKRSRMDDHTAQSAPAARRGKLHGESRASSLADVQRSLSSLLEEPNASVIPATDFGSDSEGEERTTVVSSNKENRESSGTGKAAVVDRIALKRGSSNASTGSNSRRLAFASAGAANGGFKVPALLRRATTNSLLSSSTTSSVSGSANANGKQSGAGFGEEAKLKKNAGKKSGVNYFARETERRAAVAEKEKKREAKKLRGVEGRAGVVGGLFGKGSFE